MNEKKSKKRPPADQDYNRVKIARTVSCLIFVPHFVKTFFFRRLSNNQPIQYSTDCPVVALPMTYWRIRRKMSAWPGLESKFILVLKTFYAFHRWVEEQDFDNASPEPNIDQLRPGVLPPHDLYKSAASQSALLTTPAWATAALNGKRFEPERKQRSNWIMFDHFEKVIQIRWFLFHRFETKPHYFRFLVSIQSQSLIWAPCRI